MWCLIKADRLGASTKKYKRIPGGVGQFNTSPYPAPVPHNGVTTTLDAAKQEFRTRYEEMKRMGMKPFS
jgi:hypothetical protein